MSETGETGIRPDEQLSKAFESNALQVSSNMSEAVISGRVASVYGPKYTADSLAQLADQMRNEVLELTPGSGFVNSERKAALEEERRKNLEKVNNQYLDHLLPHTMKEKMYFHELSELSEPKLFTFDNFVNGALYSYFIGDNPSFSLIYDKAKIEMEADSMVEIGEDKFHWEMDRVSKNIIMEGKVKAKVMLSTKILPVTQEEYFHAAQELSLGTVEGLKYLDDRVGKASGHVTHGSIILDRVLSSAAAEQGPTEFSYWATRANEVTKEFADRHNTNVKSKWDKTPLGKVVNQRFLYPVVDHKELGAMIYNYTRDVESFLFNPDGTINENNEAVFELLSLQFGPHHKELSLALVDTVNSYKDGEIPDFEKLGKELIEWGKKLLVYYKGKPEERELVTHHTDMRDPIDPESLKYEVSKNLVSSINSKLDTETGIPTTEITLNTLANEARVNAQSKLKLVLKAVKINLSNNTVQIVDPTVLRKVGLEPGIFSLIVRHAFHNYQRHLREYNAYRKTNRFSKDTLYKLNKKETGDHVKGLMDLIKNTDFSKLNRK